MQPGSVPATIRIAVVDNQWVVLEGLRANLGGDQRFEVVATARTRDAFVEAAPDVDVVLLDLYLEGEPSDGIPPDLDVVEELSGKYRVLVMSVSGLSDDVFDVLYQHPVGGFIRKEASPEEFREAIRTVVAGHKFVSRELAGALLRHLEWRKSVEGLKPLSPREEEVLQLVHEGLSYRAIAKQLGISEYTVNDCLNRIREKWHIENRSKQALVRKGLQDGWVSPGEVHRNIHRVRRPFRRRSNPER